MSACDQKKIGLLGWSGEHLRAAIIGCSTAKDNPANPSNEWTTLNKIFERYYISFYGRFGAALIENSYFWL